MTDPFCTITACVFDAYGTLFDMTTPVRRSAADLGEQGPKLAQIWRDKQLQYTWLRSLMHRHTDFWSLTCDSLDYALEAIGRGNDRDLRDRLLAAFYTLDPYPDAVHVLELLKNNGFVRAILSNGSPAMLERTVAGAGMGELLNAVMSVEAVGCYKPDPTVYRHAVQRLDIPPERILFISGNSWDAAGAASYGLRTVWINRAKAPAERLDVQPMVQLESLSELIGLLRLPR